MKLYHIESRNLKKSKIFYLVKGIRIGEKVNKVRVKIGNSRPLQNVVNQLTNTPNIDLEKKAIKKKIEKNINLYYSKYLSFDDIYKIEESKYWKEIFNLFLTPLEKESFEISNESEYVHGTTAIEGNTFTLQQVDELLHKGISPSGKNLREINEVQNFLKVNEYLESYKGNITISFIKKLHAIIMNNIDVESAGKFRRIDSIGIRGVDIAVTPAIFIETELNQITNEFYTNLKAGSHPFEEAILFHYKFEMIHPFTDGNGRVGRELLNHILMKSGYPKITFKNTDREAYINALIYGNEGNHHLMVPSFVKILIDKRAKLFKEILKINESNVSE